MSYLVRSLVPEDYDLAASIDDSVFCTGFGLSLAIIEKHCKQPDKFGLAAEPQGGHGICGFLLLELRKRSVKVSRFCVHPAYWRQGIAKRMLWAAMDQMNDEMNKFVVDVPEKCQHACRLLKSLGMPCWLVRDLFADQDGIRFSFSTLACAKK